MHSRFFIELYMPKSGIEKAASTEKEECRKIMQAIYDENPSYWPYGLDVESHDSVYLVKDKMTKAAAGFVGWQEFVEYPSMKKIGSYSIGILPEYRGNGFAAEAVAKLLQKKASGVDEVRCYAKSDNRPSHALANKLHINIETKF